MSSDLVESFRQVTGADAQTAASFLTACNDNLETAVSLYMDDPSAVPSETTTTEAVYRSPIPPRTEQLVPVELPIYGSRYAGSYSSGAITTRAFFSDDSDEDDEARSQVEGVNPSERGTNASGSEHTVPRSLGTNTQSETSAYRAKTVANGNHQRLPHPHRAAGGGGEEEDAELEGGEANHRCNGASTSTAMLPPQQPSASGVAKKKRSHLRQLYQPPKELLFDGGTLVSAQAAAREKHQWLLVSLHDEGCFDCHLLNRDVWKDPKVYQTVRRNFVFIQVPADSPEGIRFRARYSYLTAATHIAVLDPFTGRQKILWMHLKDAKSVHESLTEFVQYSKLMSPDEEAAAGRTANPLSDGSSTSTSAVSGLRRQADEPLSSSPGLPSKRPRLMDSLGTTDSSGLSTRVAAVSSQLSDIAGSLQPSSARHPGRSRLVQTTQANPLDLTEDEQLRLAIEASAAEASGSSSKPPCRDDEDPIVLTDDDDDDDQDDDDVDLTTPDSDPDCFIFDPVALTPSHRDADGGGGGGGCSTFTSTASICARRPLRPTTTTAPMAATIKTTETKSGAMKISGSSSSSSSRSIISLPPPPNVDEEAIELLVRLPSGDREVLRLAPNLPLQARVVNTIGDCHCNGQQIFFNASVQPPTTLKIGVNVIAQVGKGSNAVVRYTRHRWRHERQPVWKRRKVAADRLWLTLQNGLSALGVPVDLVPLVIKRAYTIADLPVPPRVAPQLETLLAKAAINNPSSSLSQQSNGVPSAGKPHAHSSSSNVSNPSASTLKRASSTSTNVDHRRVGGTSHSLDSLPPSLDDQRHDDVDSLKPSAASRHNRLADTIATELVDELSQTDDVTSVNTEAKSTSNSDPVNNGSQPTKTSDDSEDADDVEEEEAAAAADDEDVDEEEEEEEFEEDMDDDDVEWTQSRGRAASSYGNHASNKKTLSSKRPRRLWTVRRTNSFRNRVSSGKMKSQSAGSVPTHQSELSVARTDTGAPTPSSTNSELPSTGRRGSRVGAAVNTKKGMMTTGKEKTRFIDATDDWDDHAAPGFQPNVNLNPPSMEPTPMEGVSMQSNDEASLTSSQSALPTTIPNSPASIPMVTCSGADGLSNGTGRCEDAPFVQLVQSAASPQIQGSTNPPSRNLTMAQLLAAGTGNLDQPCGVPPATSYSFAESQNSTVNSTQQTSTTNAPTLGMPVPQSNRACMSNGSLVPTANALPATETVAATTTVTFFVCEVCASRYRSTAGLRYHYHSQHSGYAPKNPISASASRLVVPVGEERGIGGGLRGGRPRRQKATGTTTDGRVGRGKAKETGEIKVDSTSSQTHPTDGMVSTSANPVGALMNEMGNFRGQGPMFNSHSLMPSLSTNNYPPEMGGPHIGESPFRSRPYVGSSDYGPGSYASYVDGTHTAPRLSPADLAQSDGTRLHDTGGQMVELQRVNSPHRVYSTFNTHDVNNSLPVARASPVYMPPHTTPVSYLGSTWSTPTDTFIPQLAGPNATTTAAPNTFRMNPAQRRDERRQCPPVSTANGGGGLPICVYCMGDERRNPRLGRPEGLIRCARCTGWGHFSCVRLSAHCLNVALRYAWQCIQCKQCWHCGSSEHEYRMAFCGDCDRTFHIDCLPIPLARIPTGHWRCDVCLQTLYPSTEAQQHNRPSECTSSNLPTTVNDSDRGVAPYPLMGNSVSPCLSNTSSIMTAPVQQSAESVYSFVSNTPTAVSTEIV